MAVIGLVADDLRNVVAQHLLRMQLGDGEEAVIGVGQTLVGVDDDHARRRAAQVTAQQAGQIAGAQRCASFKVQRLGHGQEW